MKFKLPLVLLSFFCLAVVSFGQELSSRPILRIEGVSHSGKLTQISTDAANRYLVTAAEDKTVRIWEFASGKLSSILRPPIGEDRDGMIYSVAISPDGNQIAAGGWTGNPSKFFVYIFDRESGTMLHAIPDFRGVIHELTFSPDGKYLGVTLERGFGVRLYETESYRLIGEDSNYTNSSFGLDFDPTSRKLVTSSGDGSLRLYEIKDGKLNLLKKQLLKYGRHPWEVKFSPDGSKIAVGFYLFTAVTVVSSEDLSVLYDVDVSKAARSTEAIPVFFHVVDWSPDGKTLFASGTNYNKKLEYVISEWTDDGRTYRETGASVGAIYDLKALRAGGVAFGVAAPAGWGVLDGDRNRTHYVINDTPDFRNSSTGLLVNGDGSQIRFPYNVWDENPALFSLADRKLERREAKERSLKPGIVEAEGLKITDFTNGSQPILNGGKLKLNPYEASYSLAILPNNREFLIGSGWYLRLFDHRGDALWRTSVPGVVWSLNAPGNGKTAVAALGDGTIRWYRISDGQEILAFYSPNDAADRWILWTPSGYYDASPGAEDLIGWHVNNGRSMKADYFPNHLFRAYFYRPDVIDAILQTTDEAQAVKIANEKSGRKDQQLTIAKILPPVIEINSPKIKEVSSSTVKLSYKIRSHSGEPVTNFRALVDGRELNLEKPKTTNGISDLSIQIPTKDSELVLIVENRFTKSSPARLWLKWKNK